MADKAKVYYSSLENDPTQSPLNKIKRLMESCGAKNTYEKGDLVAIKVHFGELGNAAFLRPIYLRPVIDTVKQYGGNPYLVDTNTLYIGMRSNTVNHLHNASLNGFNYSTLQVPVVIADGLRGQNSVELPVPNGKLKKRAIIASDIASADALVLISHFKGHAFAGYGGAIKNLAMGCASRAGKLDMHSVSKPSVNTSVCVGCGKCKNQCREQAIELNAQKATITDKCVGCVRCVGVCPVHAIQTKMDNSKEDLQKSMTEYAAAVINSFNKPVICVNVLESIVPSCDCMPGNDAPVCPDIGFVASTDPVALDQASYDLMKKVSGGKDPLAERHDGMTGEVQLIHAETISFGTRSYELITQK
ncbi:DUF362 domain-containing protein [Deferribacterales bacterium RsTz2092]|nr:4Fe-4S ferredoxin [Deferribacterales bacterium]